LNKTVCGLNKRDLTEIVDILKALTHAVSEEDWERLLEKDYREAILRIGNFAKIMGEDGCRCLPHGLIDPSETAAALSNTIKQRDKAKALNNITDLTLSLLQDI